MRFQPPAFEVSPEAGWVLARAFGPQRAPAHGPGYGSAAFRLAHRLGLAARIGRRFGASELAAELDETSAMSFAVAGVSATRHNQRLSGLWATASAELAGRGIDVLPLKLAGLVHVGVLPLRSGLDVDVLVRPEDLVAAATALRDRGFKSRGVTENEHHAPPLVSEEGGTVEIHFAVPGIVGKRPRSHASLDDLLAAGLVERTESRNHVLRPTRTLLAAHAVVHAIAQHGFAPQGYPLLRFIEDLIDLGRPLDDATTRECVARATRGFLDADEVAAAGELARSLAEGALPSLESAAATLLRHCLAAVLVPGYARRLSIIGLWHPIAPGPRVFAITRGAFELVVPSRKTMERLSRHPLEGWALVRSHLARWWRVSRRRVLSLSGGAARR